MKQGDKLIVTIIDYGSNGEGIAKQEGYVIFAPYTIVGETVKIRITYVKKNFAQSALEEIITPSSLRRQPCCNRFTKCGGCDLLHIEYTEQLRLKKSAIQNTFAKNYKREIVIDDVVPSKNILGYRNKVSLPFGMVNNKVALGFYRENTHKIVSVTKCFLQGEWIEKIIECTLEYANSLNLSVYDEITSKGLLRNLVARRIANHTVITIVATDNLPELSLLVAKLNAYYNSYSLYLNINKNKGNSIFKGDVELIAGVDGSVKIRDVALNINPMSFLQVNDDIRDKIYDRVESLIRDKAGSVVIDAYAGVGILGANLAKKGIKVYNLEIVPQAVDDANDLARKNDIEDYVTNICGDSAIELPKLIDSLKSDLDKCAIRSMKLNQPYFDLIKEGKKRFELRLNDDKRQKINIGDSICFSESTGIQKMLTVVKNKYTYADFETLFGELGTVQTGFGKILDINLAAKSMGEFYSESDIKKYGVVAIEVEPIKPTFSVILDPPRKGAEQTVLNAINSIDLDSIIYISCNPATLSRDMEILSSRYKPDFLTPYDMFPNTRHLECLTRLVPRKVE